ncbi:MAG TPA: hypothetical protein VKB38_10865 [Terracidiphilus sp.]|nr:hypothetical protein [Terracidiphilus sp.]
MHFHIPFNTLQILWTLTFAAHLVLIVVLMGRDRIKTFPWFTASIVLVAFRLLASRLLFGRIPQMTLAAVFICLADIAAFISLMVVLEIARLAFGRVRRGTWLTGAIAVMAAGALALVFCGVWPAWKTVSSGSALQLMQLIGEKANLLVDVETVLVGALIVIFGYRFGAGWRSHVQQVAIGLSAASIGQLTIQVVWQEIARTAVAHTRAEYERILGIRDHLFNANSTLTIVVLVWWIVCLWIDEPGAKPAATATTEPVNADAAALAPGEVSEEQEATVEKREDAATGQG